MTAENPPPAADEADSASLNPNEREIDGFTYKVQPLAFSTGLPILKRLIEIVAPIAAAALRGGSALDRAAGVLEVLPTAFTEHDLTVFRIAFGPRSHYLREDGVWVPLVKNAKIDQQEAHFTGRYYAFIRWIVFCCEVNFAGFFGGATTSTDGNPMQTLLNMVTPKPSATSPNSDSGTGSSTA